MRRVLAALLAGLVAAAPLAARESLGIFDGWGSFRDPEIPRCYAISRPIRERSGDWEPFVAIGYWPERNVGGQLHVRLRRAMYEDRGARLTIGGRSFDLVGRGPDAWADNARDDAAIVAAIRAGMTMRIEAVSESGGRFADSYALAGAATAIDAAALGCAR
ncbi:MAG: hypothetical protein ABR601_09985 [Parasphingopyxis sp.]|nr:hypothetical protein [Sphingomonadales bacterium]